MATSTNKTAAFGVKLIHKCMVYADKPQTLDHLKDNIRRVIADIRPQMLEKSHRKLDVRIGLHLSQPWQSIE
ncbi:hypothetical protein TNCV_1409911 [Trichonephila clavipes]|uniref:Uncharacterized protein n=1 Tax=Trichonephila clavipes TaxID=2585209 RepID=A0A8X6R650_TRICX|nr:hypothetical protein TNCV_1409911 [Trichonephila clavipes]